MSYGDENMEGCGLDAGVGCGSCALVERSGPDGVAVVSDVVVDPTLPSISEEEDIEGVVVEEEGASWEGDYDQGMGVGASWEVEGVGEEEGEGREEVVDSWVQMVAAGQEVEVSHYSTHVAAVVETALASGQ